MILISLLNNFTIYRKDRCAGGGGVFVAISDDLRSLEDPIIDASAELVWAKLCIASADWYGLNCVLVVLMVPVYVCAFTDHQTLMRSLLPN